MASKVDELHQRLSKEMVCSFERPSFILQVLKSDVCHCRSGFKMADDHLNEIMLKFVLTEVKCFVLF